VLQSALIFCEIEWNVHLLQKMALLWFLRKRCNYTTARRIFNQFCQNKMTVRWGFQLQILKVHKICSKTVNNIQKYTKTRTKQRKTVQPGVSEISLFSHLQRSLCRNVKKFGLGLGTVRPWPWMLWPWYKIQGHPVLLKIWYYRSHYVFFNVLHTVFLLNKYHRHLYYFIVVFLENSENDSKLTD